MNVSCTFIKSYFILFLLSLPLVGFGQLEVVEVIANEGAFYDIHSSPNNPTASVNHGALTVSNLGGRNFRFSYMPDTGFYGLDTLDIDYFVNFQPARKGVVLSVIPSKVIAENDYASTVSGQPVVIDVLANDWGNRGTLLLSGIPLVNNGNAIPDNGQIVFIPEVGFEGIAHFNYIVCDDIGTCATGTVSVSVIGNTPPEPVDTTYLATAKNTTLPIPLDFDNYNIHHAPANGSLAFIAPNVIEYDPSAGFIGIDQFILKRTQNGVNYYRIFYIDVLSTQNPNGVAFDDYAYTPVNTPVEINVAENDLGNYNVISHSQSNDGLVEKISGKVLRFTPDLGFDGTATFTYTINVGSHQETATVFVTVDNQVPSSSIFDLSTFMNVPKPIYYNVPISDFNFTISDQADHGTVDFYEGQLDTTIYGQTISGYNLVIYTPDIDYVGTDEFEILYCVSTNNECQLTKINMEVKPMTVPSAEVCISEDCVWPGDGNNDGIVNMLDLLFLGYSFGDIGDPRDNPSIDWYGQFAQEWNKSAFPGSVDSKHTDMDGDGVIAANDMMAMDACYNLTHSLTPEYNVFAKNYPYYFRPTDTIPNPDPIVGGHYIEFDIVLGNSYNPIIDLTGVTFSFDFSPTDIDPNSIEVTFDDNSWFNFNSPTLELVKKPWLGRADVGYTRTNAEGVSGYGKIGKLSLLSFIIEDDLDTRINNLMYVSNVRALNSKGNYIGLPDGQVVVPIVPRAEGAFAPSDLTVYPNPTSGALNLHLQGDNVIEHFQIYSMTGKALYSSGYIYNIAAQMDVSDLPAGIYLIHTQTSKGVVTKKVQVQ